MVDRIEIKISESDSLKKQVQGTPVGKHTIKVNAFLNGAPAGTCILNVSRVHESAPVSVGMHLLDMPSSETKLLLTARRLLNSVVGVCKKRGITRATFVPHKKERYAKMLTKYSALFSPHATLGGHFYFDPTKKPLIYREKFFTEFRQKSQAVHKPLAPKFVNARIAKNIHAPARRH